MTPSVSGMVSAYMTSALYKYNNCITFKFSLVETRPPESNMVANMDPVHIGDPKVEDQVCRSKMSPVGIFPPTDLL